MNRTDSIAYSPAGYNPVYATWEANAASNRAMLTFNVPSGETLSKPVIVLHHYSGGAIPRTVTLDGMALQHDDGYFASYRADTQDLWMTLATNLSGSHEVAIDGTVDIATPSPTAISTPSPGTHRVFLPDAANDASVVGGP